jgi:eukaryotic-like serine/threonine-protein kinase
MNWFSRISGTREYTARRTRKADLWILPLTCSDGKPRLFLRTQFHEAMGRFSPESSPRWVAYQSDETGRYEIFIQGFPEPRGKFQISTRGGQYPQWGPRGRELYYLASDNKIMAVDLTLGADSLVASSPRVLFTLPPLSISILTSPYEADFSGQRFLVLAAPPGETGTTEPDRQLARAPKESTLSR